MFFLESDLVGLRPLEESDIEGNYLNWFNDINVCRFNSHHKFPKTKDELLEYVRTLKGNHSIFVMAVIEKSSNNHIGNISLQEIDYINSQAEIAFIFGETPYWNKGYASSAAKLLLTHAFMELGLNRVYFGTADNNIAMQKLGEKLGFKKIGIRRSALFKEGVYHDIFDFDILKTEWEA